MMVKDRRNRFSQTMSKFLNMFTSCSRSSADSFLITSPIMARTNIGLSSRRVNRTPIYPITHDQTRRKELTSPSSSSSSSSSLSASKCHSCSSTSTLPFATTTNIEVLNQRTDLMEKSSVSPPPTSSRFSYIIRPSTPCIFGGDYYEEDEDEFFLTAGGIVHSCPNIYELTIDHHRKRQSCDHLMFVDQQTTLTNDHQNNHLNCYDTELDRYSIVPRFQTIPSSSSSSTDSLNSELQLYRERHAIGFSHQYHDDTSPYSASILPTTWKSDNYLLLMPLIDPRLPLLNSKRSRSYDLPIEEPYSSVVA